MRWNLCNTGSRLWMFSILAPHLTLTFILVSLTPHPAFERDLLIFFLGLLLSAPTSVPVLSETRARGWFVSRLVRVLVKLCPVPGVSCTTNESIHTLKSLVGRYRAGQRCNEVICPKS